MMSKNDLLHSGLVSNLNQVLQNRNKGINNTPPNEDEQSDEQSPSSLEPDLSNDDDDSKKPCLLVTNGDGIDSPGLTFLVQALVDEGIYSVNVCAPQSDKSVSGHAVTLQETVAVTSVDIKGATAYEVSGTPVDCVSLALSGALFACSKPMLLISGINKGSRCGSQMFYSGAVAGAREALLCGVPSISISLNWMKDESKESDFQDAVSVCLPIIKAALRDIETGIYPKSRSLNIEIPKSPLTNKGFKLTKQSLWRSPLSWQAVSTNRQGNFMSNQQSLGLQLAQLGRDASAAGAARRLGTQKQSLEIVESVGVAGKSDFNRVKKYFRQEEDMDEDFDCRALENGFVAITPLFISSHIDPEAQASASDWISSALNNI